MRLALTNTRLRNLNATSDGRRKLEGARCMARDVSSGPEPHQL